MRAPFIPQLQEIDCGPASLASVLAAHGRRVPVSILAAACGTGRDGTTAAGICAAAREHGLSATALRAGTDPDSVLRRLGFPLIALTRDHHYLVAERLTAQSVDIVDPASGRSTMTRAAFFDRNTGLYIGFTPGPDFRTGGARPERPLGRLLRTIDLRGRVALIFASVLLFLSAAAVIAMALLVRSGIATSWPSGRIIVVLVAMAAASGLLAWWGAAAVTSLTHRTIVPLADALVRRLVRVGPAFTDTRFLGEVAMRPQQVDSAVGSSVERFVGAVTATLMLIVAVTALAIVSPMAAAVAAAGAGASALIRVSGRATAQALGRAGLAEEAVRDGDLLQSLSTMNVLRSEAAPTDIVRRWRRRQDACDEHGDRLMDHVLRRTRIAQAADSLGVIAAVCVTWLTTGSALSLSVAPLLCAGVFAASHTLLEMGGVGASSLGAAWNAFDDVLDAPEELTAVTDPTLAPGTVLCRQAVIAGRGRAEMLTIDLLAEPDEQLLVTGASGAGKSTLLRMIAGFVPPRSGFVGRGPGPVSLVPQRPLLVEGTIRDVLRLGSDIPDGVLDSAIAVVELTDVVERRGGLDALVAHGGANFSGGERQRLALARALAHPHSVLLLDEALSAVEDALSARIHSRLGEHGATVIAVTHRVPEIPGLRAVRVEHGRLVASSKTVSERWAS